MQNEVIYHCKASSHTPIMLVGMMMGAGLPVMFLTMLIHPIVAVVAMIGTMYFVGNAFTGQTEFTMNSLGIFRALTPTVKLGRKTKLEGHSWEQLSWFKEGKDRGRYSAEYQYLELHFNNGDTWMITDNNGARSEAFRYMLDEFKAEVARRNAQSAGVAAHANTENAHTVIQPNPAQPLIIQKKTIYESVWGKIFTVILGAVIVVFVYLHVTTVYVKSTSLFKLYFILIPGFIYMWYRVFSRKK